MLKRFRIENFRGIKKGELKDLKKINILVGKNNSGKSTVLEAIHLCSAFLHEKDVFGRDIFRYILTRRTKRGGEYYPSLWYRYDINSQITFTINDYISFKLEYPDILRLIFTDMDNYDHIVSINLSKRENYLYEVFYDINKLKEHKYDIKSFLTKFLNDLTKDRVFILDGDLEEVLEQLQSIYIDDDAIRNFHSIEKNLWGRMLPKRIDKKLKDILNSIYDDNIEGFTYAPFDGENALVFLYEDKSIRVDEMGDGIKYALVLLGLILSEDIPIVLLEEPENHQHPGVFNDLAKNLVDVVKEKDIQIFITTHSIELIDAFVEAVKNKKVRKVSMNIYHLSLNKDGILQVRKMKKPDVEVLRDLGIDIRMLDNYA